MEQPNSNQTNKYDLQTLEIKKPQERFFKLREHNGKWQYWCAETGEEMNHHAARATLDVVWGLNDSQAKALLDKAKVVTETAAEHWLPEAGRVAEFKGMNVVNHWRPSKVASNVFADATEAKEAAKPFLDWCDLAFGDQAPWVLNWLAYRFQNPKPKNKPHTALYLWGVQGCGKSTFGEVMTEVFGKTQVVTVNGAEGITSKGAVANWGRCFLVAEEVDVKVDSKMYHTLKTYTGKDETTADQKFKKHSVWSISSQLVMISNNPPSFLPADDRRFAVFNCSHGKEMVGDDFKEQLLGRGTLEGVAAFLKLLPVDESLVHKRPITLDRTTAVNSSLCVLTLQISDWLEANPSVLAVTVEGMRSLNGKALSESSNAITHRMKAAGLEALPYPVRDKANKQVRAWKRTDTPLEATKDWIKSNFIAVDMSL